MSSSGTRESEPERTVGLCARCRHARRQTTRRGSTFWRCQLAETDARFARYPPLPVRVCAGYEESVDG